MNKSRGFTLIELLVVMSVIAVLLTIASPKFFKSIDHSKDAALRQDLHIMRDALDKYYGDNGRFPDTLIELVSKGYLRAIPPDPITESPNTWVVVPPSDPHQNGIANVKSGALGKALDGTTYATW